MNVFKISVVALVVLVIAAAFFFFRQGIAAFFENLRMAFAGSVNGDLSYRSLLDFRLSRENSLLSGASSSGPAPSSTIDGFHYLDANVFSDYPFNNYSLVAVNAGEIEGLKEGMPVLAAPGVLLGKIVSVGPHKSAIQTFFDPSWKSSVFVGTAGTRGLLDGGASPSVDFIPKNSTTTAGMEIFNADSSYPLNLLVGSVDSVQGVNSDLWLQAKVRVPFDLSSLNDVMVITDFR